MCVLVFLLYNYNPRQFWRTPLQPTAPRAWRQSCLLAFWFSSLHSSRDRHILFGALPGGEVCVVTGFVALIPVRLEGTVCGVRHSQQRQRHSQQLTGVRSAHFTCFTLSCGLAAKGYTPVLKVVSSSRVCAPDDCCRRQNFSPLALGTLYQPVDFVSSRRWFPGVTQNKHFLPLSFALFRPMCRFRVCRRAAGPQRAASMLSSWRSLLLSTCFEVVACHATAAAAAATDVRSH